MKIWVKILSVFMLLYAFFLVAFMPAHIVFNQILLPNNIQIGQLKGSVWSSEVSAVHVNGFTINQVNIKVNPLSLLMFNPKLDVTFGDALLSGPEGELSLDGLFSTPRVFDGKMNVKASDVVNLIPLPISLRAHSFIDIELNEFIPGKEVCSVLIGTLHWSKAAVTAFEQKIALGKLGADLSCNQGDAVLTVQKKNDLGLEFSLFVGKGFKPTGNGYIKPTAKTPNEIKQALPFIGKPDNQGRYKLRF